MSRIGRSRSALSRRVAAALGSAWCASMLGGCGFQPVYGERGVAATSLARRGLAAISVGIMPERPGQLLRQALQERFERFGADAERRYALSASFRITTDAVGIQPDSTVTRLRLTGYAEYSLTSLDAARRTVTSGSARAVDGYDSVNEQFFAADLENDRVVERLAAAVADQVALQLANYFDAHGLA